MTACRKRDRQQPSLVLSTHVEILMYCLSGNKGKFAGTQMPILLLNLKLKRSFEDEKCFIVTMPMEWNSLLWRNPILEEGKGAISVGSDSKKCYNGGGNLKDLSLLELFRQHDTVFPFFAYCFSF